MESIPISGQRKAQLEALARQQGKDLAAATDDVLALGLEQQHALNCEEQDIRGMLDGRYDDAVSGKAQLLDPDDVRRDLAGRRAAHIMTDRP
jgi:hypothetical protein